MVQALRFLDKPVVEMTEFLALQVPEKGGMFMGPPGWNLVSDFLKDEEAYTDSVTYCPSEYIKRLVPEHAIRTGNSYNGSGHSHPGVNDTPSAQDMLSAKIELDANPHVPVYHMAIITTRHRGELQPNELALGPGKLSLYCAERGRGGKVLISTDRHVAVIPLHHHLQLIAQRMAMEADQQVTLGSYGGAQLISGHLKGEFMEMDYLVGLEYPFMPPVVIVTPSGGDPMQLQLKWDLNLESDERLIEALRPLISGTPPYQWAYGPAGGPAFTTDPERARKAGWVGRFASEDPALQAGVAHLSLFARSQGIVSESLQGKSVAVFGLGSVGSYQAVQLARSGIGKFTFVDDDIVSSDNLCRTAYGIEDVDKSKVEALERIVLNVSPAAEVNAYHQNVLSFEIEDLMAIIASSDLVVASTDSPEAQALLNHLAYQAGVPAVFCALYKGAQGGEVIFTVPEAETPCHRCAAPMRDNLDPDGETRVRRNYGTGRLEGEFALAPDIQHVASAAVKIALSLLTIGIEEARLSKFLLDPLDYGANYLIFTNDQDFWFLPDLFRELEVPSQFAYQAAWMKPTRNPECPICGDDEHRCRPIKPLAMGD